MTSAVTGRHSNQLNYRATRYRAMRRNNRYYYKENPVGCQHPTGKFFIYAANWQTYSWISSCTSEKFDTFVDSSLRIMTPMPRALRAIAETDFVLKSNLLFLLCVCYSIDVEHIHKFLRLLRLIVGEGQGKAEMQDSIDDA